VSADSAPERKLIGPPHAHLDAPCTDACYEPAPEGQVFPAPPHPYERGPFAVDGSQVCGICGSCRAAAVHRQQPQPDPDPIAPEACSVAELRASHKRLWAERDEARAELAEARRQRNAAVDKVRELQAAAADGEHFDEDTLRKVYDALGSAGLSGEVARRVVTEMQNLGILFRERARPPRVLPCGHRVDASLFELTNGGQVLIMTDPTPDGCGGTTTPLAWCTQGHGWVQLTADEHASLKDTA
jgi:hypothetical protein